MYRREISAYIVLPELVRIDCLFQTVPEISINHSLFAPFLANDFASIYHCLYSVIIQLQF